MQIDGQVVTVFKHVLCVLGFILNYSGLTGINVTSQTDSPLLVLSSVSWVLWASFFGFIVGGLGFDLWSALAYSTDLSFGMT